MPTPPPLPCLQESCPAAARLLPPDCQDAHPGRHGLHDLHWAAHHLPPQRPQLLRELPAHDVCGWANVAEAVVCVPQPAEMVQTEPWHAAKALRLSLPPPRFLPCLSAVPSERYEVDPELAKALEIIFILHLDHEQNASTSTVRTAGKGGLCKFALGHSRHIGGGCFNLHQACSCSDTDLAFWPTTTPLLACPRLQALPRPTPLPAWPRALQRCGAPHTVAPTRRCSRCVDSWSTGCLWRST